jgi:hypothetical protein
MERKLIAMEVKRQGTQIEMGPSRPLFGGRILPVSPAAKAGADVTVGYITPDAKRILLAVPTNLYLPTPIALRTNWAGDLGTKR